MQSNKVKFYVNDLLCGLGGATEGVHQSDYAEVQVGLNHSEHAIAINQANHPKVSFYIKDLYAANDLKPCDIVIAGIECTNHSNAKGGMSRDADSRAMANEMFRYSVMTGCKVMILENVKEFLDWGPLMPKRDENGVTLKIKKGKNKGKPIMVGDPKRKGQYFHKWVYKMEHEYGFCNFQMRVLCAADYGVATTRKRLFMIFAKDGWTIRFPEPTHSKDAGLFGLKPWVPCKDFIDLNNHGASIFGRTKKDGSPDPLVPNTLRRIAYGLKKYGMSKKEKWIMKYYGTGSNLSDLDDPLHTVTVKDRHAVVSSECFYVQNYHNSPAAGSVELPLKTVVTKDEKAFLTAEVFQFVDKYFSKEHNVSSVDDPLGTVTTEQKMSVCSMDLIMSEFNRDSAIKPVSDPMNTMTTFVGKRKINVQFMASSYSRKTPTVRSINDPLRTITTFQSPQLVTAELARFASDYMGQDDVYLLHTKDGDLVGVHIGDGIFLTDIKMRWLSPRELASCQGFPTDYKLIGTKTEQVKGIGNSIPPAFIKHIVNSIGKANADKLVV